MVSKRNKKRKGKGKTNRKYKDSLFTLLFGKEKNLLELYGAVKNEKFDKNTKIQITTLRNVLYRKRINDISFVINGKVVVLIEHQSTINDNMPLRMLIYAVEIYKKIIKGDDIFCKERMLIPKPEFIVLYNGNDKCPDQQVLKLSDMYAEDCDEDVPELELTVKVFNINKGHNKELAAKSKVLSGYENFIYLVKEYSKTMSRDKAIDRAIEDCIRQDILKDFLEEHSSEVRNMLLRDLTLKEHRAVAYKDGVYDGMAKGLKQAAKAMKASGEAVGKIMDYTGLSRREITTL